VLQVLNAEARIFLYENFLSPGGGGGRETPTKACAFTACLLVI
jgi:hypothetical protein